MRYYIIAGEASGDLHGAQVIKELYRQDRETIVRCWGGDKMKKAGGDLQRHYKDLAYMGFVEVITHLPKILQNIKFCKEDIKTFDPDVLVLIDYPGFNLRIASWAKKSGINVCYYISPQLWAWKENRIKTIKESVDKMLVILPFEQAFYKKHKFQATFVGNPLIEIVLNELLQPIVPISEKPIIALLPGSRSQEIRKKLPTMLKMIPYFPDCQFVVAQAPGQTKAFYKEIIGENNSVLIVKETYNLLKQAVAALVTSGTATLETALFGVPQVVCYKGNPISFWVAKSLIRVKFISLVNLILDKPAVKELIQDDFTERKLSFELNEILQNDDRQDAMQSDYTLLWELLGHYKTSELVAKEIIGLAQSTERSLNRSLNI